VHAIQRGEPPATPTKILRMRSVDFARLAN